MVITRILREMAKHGELQGSVELENELVLWRLRELNDTIVVTMEAQGIDEPIPYAFME